ncbi:MAG: hypothetical protein OQL20_03580 [Sedimenticola sp.]|nr:hypothetical protein [Sedimenticola sp.]
MSDSKDKKPSEIENVTEDQQVSSGRRKFTKAALMASPVIMTAASKPVWATGTGRRCTVSVLMSGGSAPMEDISNCRSCSPGYWHHDNACWSTAGMADKKLHTFGDFFLTNFNTANYYTKELEALNTRLEDFFPSAQSSTNSNKFFKFARAATASYLNAQAFGHTFMDIPSTSKVLSLIGLVFYPSRTTLPDLDNFDIRENKANKKAEYLAGYYDDNSATCILPNNGNCPNPGFTL